jgi:hypothetical protein
MSRVTIAIGRPGPQLPVVSSGHFAHRGLDARSTFGDNTFPSLSMTTDGGAAGGRWRPVESGRKLRVASAAVGVANRAISNRRSDTVLGWRSNRHLGG